MRKLIICILLAFSSTLKANDTLSTMLMQADSAYLEGEFSQALNLWEEIQVVSDLENADLFYNMGNAAWRLKSHGKAILYWNKALKLNPDMEDAKANLAMTDEILVDKIDPVQESQINYFLEQFWTYLSPTRWGLFGVVALFIMLMCIVIFKKTNHSFSSYFLPFSFIFLFIGSIAIFAGVQHQSLIDNSHTAVVIRPNIYVKSAPMIGGGDAFILHEGTQMSVIRQAGSWFEIKLADGKVGWVQDGEVGIF